jgi:hypothetical protein
LHRGKSDIGTPSEAATPSYVEVREVVVLLLDLDVSAGKLLVLFLHLAQALADAPVLLLEVLDLE